MSDRFASIVGRLGGGTTPNTDDLTWLVVRHGEARKVAEAVFNFLQVLRTDALNTEVAAAAAEAYEEAEQAHALSLSLAEAMRVLDCVHKGVQVEATNIFGVASEYVAEQEAKRIAAEGGQNGSSVIEPLGDDDDEGSQQGENDNQPT